MGARAKKKPADRKPHRPVIALRIDQVVFDRIRKAAQANNRSMGGEVAHRISQAFKR